MQTLIVISSISSFTNGYLKLEKIDSYDDYMRFIHRLSWSFNLQILSRNINYNNK